MKASGSPTCVKFSRGFGKSKAQKCFLPEHVSRSAADGACGEPQKLGAGSSETVNIVAHCQAAEQPRQWRILPGSRDIAMVKGVDFTGTPVCFTMSMGEWGLEDGLGKCLLADTGTPPRTA